MDALFAAAHGYAHGVEMPAGDAPGFVAGLMAVTALLHAAGLGFAWRISSRRRAAIP